jgi:hypothetical protein
LRSLGVVITLVLAQRSWTDEAFYFDQVGKAIRRQNEFLILPHSNDTGELTSEKYPNLSKKERGT